MNGSYLRTNFTIFVIPAQAGIQEYRHHQAFWIPACAGMTAALGLSKRHSDPISLIRWRASQQTTIHIRP
ncbi:MAG: hypothetical protein DBP01_10450 [gamma proteobacterium symbiont of Ctena orbiculata]|nr:MAG: hypothetical protein DBP01_10450 [gamma proteobacterium symbiont of Ctena orbiculata]